MTGVRICAWPTCNRPAAPRHGKPGQFRTMCGMHIARKKRGADMDAPPGTGRGRKKPWPDRFWEKVDRRGDDECWPWLASLNDKGYAQINMSGKMARGHRISYELLREPIPEGLVLDHLCRNRWCVNPWHLEAVPNDVNIRRGIPFRVPVVNTHCPNGHEYTDENTRIASDGYKRCRTCERAQSLAAYYKRSEFNTLDRTDCTHCGKDVAIMPHSRQFANHMVALEGCRFDCCQMGDTCPGSMRTAAEVAQEVHDRSGLREWRPRSA